MNEISNMPKWYYTKLSFVVSLREDNEISDEQNFCWKKSAICYTIYKSKKKISQKLEEDQKCDGREVSLTAYANKQLLE